MDKTDEVKVAIVPDVLRPFCPLPKNKLFMNAINRKEDIEKIIEKIGVIISETQPQKNNIPGSVSGAAIYAGMQSLKGNGGRVILFTSNSCINGFGSSRPRDDRLLANPDKEKVLYSPQVRIFNKFRIKNLNTLILLFFLYYFKQ